LYTKEISQLKRTTDVCKSFILLKSDFTDFIPSPQTRELSIKEIIILFKPFFGRVNIKGNTRKYIFGLYTFTSVTLLTSQQCICVCNNWTSKPVRYAKVHRTHLEYTCFPLDYSFTLS